MPATSNSTSSPTAKDGRGASKKSSKNKAAAGKKISPGRRQFLEFKAKYPDSLLLIRMGDFYEAFDDDAHTLSKVLGIALTARESGAGGKAPLAGIPHHSLDNHLGTLVASGLKIAIAEQTSDPAKSRGLVDRAVVRVVTPGTVLEPALLDQSTNNYLAAAVSDGERAGLAYVDISTSEFVTGEFPASDLKDELFRLSPAELIADSAALELVHSEEESPLITRPLDESRLDTELSTARLMDHFKVTTLEAFGCEKMPFAIVAASSVLDFVADTQLGAIPQLTSLRTESTNSYMKLDQKALRDLEVFSSSIGKTNAPNLYRTLDFSKTAMGARTLRSWLTRPLINSDDIRRRQEIVGAFFDDQGIRSTVQGLLSQVSDLERLTNRIRTNTATPRDLASLRTGLAVIPQILEALPAAIERGLNIPLVYNCGGYENVKTLQLLEEVFDIYMPDFKFWDNRWADVLCNAPDYREMAETALKEMFRQVGDLTVSQSGIAERGLIVRHLVMPNEVAGTENILRFIAAKISPHTYVNVMDQYRPCYRADSDPKINRRIVCSEFDQALTWAREAGLMRLDKRVSRHA